MELSNGSHVIVSLLEENEIVHVSRLEQCLAHSRCSIQMYLYTYMFPFGVLGQRQAVS